MTKRTRYRTRNVPLAALRAWLDHVHARDRTLTDRKIAAAIGISGARLSKAKRQGVKLDTLTRWIDRWNAAQGDRTDVEVLVWLLKGQVEVRGGDVVE